MVGLAHVLSKALLKLGAAGTFPLRRQQELLCPWLWRLACCGRFEALQNPCQAPYPRIGLLGRVRPQLRPDIEDMSTVLAPGLRVIGLGGGDITCKLCSTSLAPKIHNSRRHGNACNMCSTLSGERCEIDVEPLRDIAARKSGGKNPISMCSDDHPTVAALSALFAARQ